MIVRWKQVSADKFVAKWQDNDLALAYVVKEKRWCLFLNGARCTDRWLTARAGQEATDAKIQSIVVRNGATVQARQRPLSGERISKHGSSQRDI